MKTFHHKFKDNFLFRNLVPNKFFYSFNSGKRQISHCLLLFIANQYKNGSYSLISNLNHIVEPNIIRVWGNTFFDQRHETTQHDNKKIILSFKR